MTSPFRTLAGLLLVGTVSLGCGGGSSSGSGTSSADSTSSTESSDDSTESEDGDTDSETSSSDRPTRAASSGASIKATCAAGGCSECGEGACPPGMFCIKSAGGNGCSWFPECGNNADCGCIAKHIGSQCECEMRGQFARVTCQ